MRINLDADATDAPKKNGKGTRGQRAAEHAVNRLKNRHVERDYFGRPITDGSDEQGRATPSVSEAKGGIRLDAWLVANGHAASREKAKALIAAGSVQVNGSSRVKGSTVVLDGSQVEVRAN